MASSFEDEVLTRYNHTLLNVVKILEVLFWVGLVVTLVMCFANAVQMKNLFDQSSFIRQDNQDFWSYLASNPVEAFSFVVTILNKFVNGVVFMFVAKGISLGLRIIVETEINYRLAGEDNHG